MNEEKKQTKQITADQIAQMQKFDQFMLEYVDHLVTRMESMNDKMAAYVEGLLKERVELDAARTAIGDLFRLSMQSRDFEGMQKLMESLGKSSTIDFDIKALVGMVHYNLLLCRRFASFRNTLQMLDVLNVASGENSRQKENLLKYGPELQYIWKLCHSQCRTLAEKEMFVKALTSKGADKTPK